MKSVLFNSKHIPKKVEEKICTQSVVERETKPPFQLLKQCGSVSFLKGKCVPVSSNACFFLFPPFSLSET